MKTNIYFVRHAEINYIPDEYSRPLTEKGKMDVLKLTELFRKYEVSKVISSPYLRAVNTVEGIAKDREIVIEIIDDFKERKVSDEWIEDFTSFSKQQWCNFDFSLEGGESLNEVQARGVGALNNVLRKYNGENIVIGTHGTILAAILNYYDKGYNYDFWKSMKMPDIFKITFRDMRVKNIVNMKI